MSINQSQTTWGWSEQCQPSDTPSSPFTDLWYSRYCQSAARATATLVTSAGSAGATTATTKTNTAGMYSWILKGTRRQRTSARKGLRHATMEFTRPPAVMSLPDVCSDHPGTAECTVGSATP